MKKFFLLAFIFLPLNTSAQVCGEDCFERPSCEDLGYKQGINCPESYVTCPFDPTFLWCKQYTCADGRYENSPKNANEGYACEAVSYHGLTCYECEVAVCANGKYNRSTCWNGQLYELVTNADLCVSLGYTDIHGYCDEYLVCPADETRIKCILR